MVVEIRSLRAETLVAMSRERVRVRAVMRAVSCASWGEGGVGLGGG